jgi:hypothetical protein
MAQCHVALQLVKKDVVDIAPYRRIMVHINHTGGRRMVRNCGDRAVRKGNDKKKGHSEEPEPESPVQWQTKSRDGNQEEQHRLLDRTIQRLTTNKGVAVERRNLRRHEDIGQKRVKAEPEHGRRKYIGPLRTAFQQNPYNRREEEIETEPGENESNGYESAPVHVSSPGAEKLQRDDEKYGDNRRSNQQIKAAGRAVDFGDQLVDSSHKLPTFPCE